MFQHAKENKWDTNSLNNQIFTASRVSFFVTMESFFLWIQILAEDIKKTVQKYIIHPVSVPRWELLTGENVKFSKFSWSETQE